MPQHPSTTDFPGMLSRRHFLEMGLIGLAFAESACALSGGDNDGDGKLSARPRDPSKTPPPIGLSSLGIASGRDASIYVPAGFRVGTPASLMVMLHGAGQAATEMTGPRFRQVADDFSVVLLAPDSRDGSWDIRYGGFGKDVEFIDRALGWAFDRIAVAPSRVGVAGFSDGGSYSLSLGMSNGDFFQKLIAFSPGFFQVKTARGKPPIFISHGTEDGILPIASTSRRIVPQLEQAGYLVQYREFEGPHTVPEAVAREAFTWLGFAAP